LLVFGVSNPLVRLKINIARGKNDLIPHGKRKEG